ncbi:MAG: HpcH/HpaI aldolase/citrate lyase family protein [Sphingomonadaceae bacterium]
MDSLKTRLTRGELLTGCMLTANSPALVELLAICGYDYVLIDRQHTPASWETVETLIRAADAAGIASLVRIPEITEVEILRALDLGAQGILLPFVGSAADIIRTADAAYYHPKGNRSICSQTRVAAYGVSGTPYIDRLAALNERTLIIGVVEDMGGIEALPEILAVSPGVDAIAIGRGDLAASLGFAGQQRVSEVLAAVEKGLALIDAARRERPDLSLAVFTYGEEEIGTWRDHGATLFCHMSEVSFLAKSAKSYLDACKR